MNSDSYYTLAAIAITMVLVVLLTGCHEHSTRYEWSSDKACLVDHYEELCYFNPNAMAHFTHHDSTHAAQIFERAQMVKRIEAAEKQMQQEARTPHKSIPQSEEHVPHVNHVPNVPEQTSEERVRRNLDAIKEHFEKQDARVPPSVMGALNH